LHIDKSYVIDELRKHAQDEHVQKAIDELPERIDHEKHAQLLQKYGIDPGELAQKAARRTLTSL
jgi:hypothetical protein